mgnify:CR=1 FL=1
MGNLEEILFDAERIGKRTEMFEEINKIKLAYPSLKREEIYEKAYQNITKNEKK